MSLIRVILIIATLLVSDIVSEEKFCDKSRKLLLGGVFNYDRILFLYSWKEVNSVQSSIAWKYQNTKKGLKPIGQDVTVDQIFPTIPLFKTGFGLTMKCEGSDPKCKSYRQLVFIFFQTSYKTFRFANDYFATEIDKSKIPWGLNPRGEATDWAFGSPIDSISSIMFMSGYQSQIFMISKDTLYVSPVDINAKALKWTQVAQSKDLNNALGGFVVGSELFINKNEASNNVLFKYDQSGKALEQIEAWKYFLCDKIETRTAPGLEAKPEDEENSIDAINEMNNNLALIIMIAVFVVIIVTNIVTSLFWLYIYKKRSGATEA